MNDISRATRVSCSSSNLHGHASVLQPTANAEGAMTAAGSLLAVDDERCVIR